jgi:hypothetical protein
MVRRAAVLFFVLCACSRKERALEPAPPPSSAPSPIPRAGAQAMSAPAAGSGLTAVAREAHVVDVDGVRELWTLRWRDAPRAWCMQSGYEPPCQGFAYGEIGSLELVRERPGEPADALLLDSLFPDGVAKLAKYAVLADDVSFMKPDVIRQRPVLEKMELRDYDHDGRDTEFVLQVDAALPHLPSVVVGISTREPRLHVFRSESEPGKPLALPNPRDWEYVRSRSTVTLSEWLCSEHEPHRATTMTVSVVGQRFITSHRTERCTGDPGAGF